MTSEEFNGVVARSRERQDRLLAAKGADYTRRSPDRLSNFKRWADELQLEATKVWAVYAGKHWDAIVAFVKTGRAESEPIQGRLDDLHNYLYLLEALLESSGEKGEPRK